MKLPLNWLTDQSCDKILTGTRCTLYSLYTHWTGAYLFLEGPYQQA